MLRLFLLCGSAGAFVAPAIWQRGPVLHAAALAEGLDLKVWCANAGIAADKFDVDSATVTQEVAALEVLARVPRSLTLSAARRKDWPGKLTAAAIEAVEEGDTLLSHYVQSWRGGGWATSSDDLEPRDQETVDSLLATGSDNDFEIFKKFGMKCWTPCPCSRAARGLRLVSLATQATQQLIAPPTGSRHCAATATKRRRAQH